MKHNTTYVNCNAGFISCVRNLWNGTRNSFRGIVFFALVVGMVSAAFGAQVVSILPSQNALSVSSSANIEVTFNTAMNTSSFTSSSFVVSGNVSGRHTGSFSFSGGNTIATFNPTNDFKNGEVVTVHITSNVKDATNASVTPFVSQFTVSNALSAGLFAAKVDYTTGGGLNSVFVYDIDNDGDGDIATAGGSTVSILKNNGNGFFAPKVDYVTGAGAYSVFIYDIDNDGDGDVVDANYSSATVSILKNNGDGTFGNKTDYATDNDPSSVYISDIDGDGDGDIAVVNGFSQYVSILKNNGDGTFQAKVDYTVVSNARSIFIADIDGDGDGDLVFTNGFSTVSVLKNNGDGTFANKADFEVGINTNPIGVFVSDIDGDGDGDIVVANYEYDEAYTVSILKNNGNGTFAPNVAVETEGNNPWGIYVSDIDGDGDGDIIVTNYGSATVSVMGNDGSGNFSGGITYATGFAPQSVFISDVNNDGLNDIIAGNTSSNTISVLKNLTLEFSVAPGILSFGDIAHGNLKTDSVIVSNTKTGTLLISNVTSNNSQFTVIPTSGSIASGDSLKFYITYTPTTAGEQIGSIIFTHNVQTSPDTVTVSGTGIPLTITAIAVGSGSIFPSGNVIVNYGDDKEFTFTPFTGYHTDSVVVDGVNQYIIPNYIFTNVDASHTITAYFSINTYTIVAEATHGIITPQTITVNYGVNQRFTFSPATGYHIDSVIVNRVKVDSTTSYTFYNIMENDTIRVVFAIYTYTITVNEPVNGTITPPTSIVNYGTYVPFTIIPNTGYHIESVFIDDVNIGDTSNFTFDSVTTDHKISATFAINTYTLTATAQEKGSISPSGTMVVNYGSSQTYLIASNYGYRIDSVVVDGASVGSVTSYDFTAIEANHSIAAYFGFIDTIKYRTFKESVTDFTAKKFKLEYKKGKLIAPPKMMTALENVFAKQVPKAGRTFLGVSQTNKDSAKVYAWVHIKSASAFAKGFKTMHTGQSYPLDTFRNPSAGVRKKLSKAFMFESKYNNSAIAQGILMKLNILASDTGITPNGFGTLVIDTTISLAGREMKGQTLLQTVNYYDSIMTYWKRFGIDSTVDYQQLGNFALYVLKPINDRFYAAIDTAKATRNYTTDSLEIVKGTPATGNKKNAYAVTLKGVKTATDAGLVKYIPLAKTNALLFSDVQDGMPSGISLEQNYPNPFNPQTAIGFSLLAVGNVTLKVYDVLGQEVATLLNNEILDEGEHEVQFDASRLSSGVYYYRLSIGAFTEVKKMVLMK